MLGWVGVIFLGQFKFGKGFIMLCDGYIRSVWVRLGYVQVILVQVRSG
jgi:hypothetical protein